MDGAVVAGIHHHEFPVQPMRRRNRSRPWASKRTSVSCDQGGMTAIFSAGMPLAMIRSRMNRSSAMIFSCAPQAEPGHRIQQPGGQGTGPQPAGGDGLVRVEIHDPINERGSPEPSQPRAQE